MTDINRRSFFLGSIIAGLGLPTAMAATVQSSIIEDLRHGASGGYMAFPHGPTVQWFRVEIPELGTTSPFPVAFKKNVHLVTVSTDDPDALAYTEPLDTTQVALRATKPTWAYVVAVGDYDVMGE